MNIRGCLKSWQLSKKSSQGISCKYVHTAPLRAMSKLYSSNLTQQEWEVVEPLIPSATHRWSCKRSGCLGGTQRHFLCVDSRMHLAEPTWRFSQLANCVYLFSELATRWNMGEYPITAKTSVFALRQRGQRQEPDMSVKLQMLPCDRITRVYSSALEESVQKFLESLGKLKRPYLTALEKKLLSILESEIEAESAR